MVYRPSPYPSVPVNCSSCMIVCKKLTSVYDNECAHRSVFALVNFLRMKNTNVTIARIPAAAVVLNIGKLCFVW